MRKGRAFFRESLESTGVLGDHLPQMATLARAQCKREPNEQVN